MFIILNIFKASLDLQSWASILTLKVIAIRSIICFIGMNTAYQPLLVRSHLTIRAAMFDVGGNPLDHMLTDTLQ